MTSPQRSDLAPERPVDHPETEQPQATGPVARTLVGLGAVFSLLQFHAFEPRMLAPGLAMMLAVVVVTIIAVRWRGQHDSRLGLWLLIVGIVSGVALTCGQSMLFTAGFPFTGVIALILGVCAWFAIGSHGRRAGVGFALLLVTFSIIALGDLALYEVQIDVKPFLQDGIDAALAGHSPYDITIANPYNAAETAKYLGPGAVVDGRVLYGYPYLPVPLLLDVPAHLLGDARWMHLISVLGAGAIAWRLSTDRIGRAASVLLVVNPLTTTVLIAYWIEPVMVLLLAASVWAMRRGNRWAGVLLGLLFASKQYAVSFVPALWSVARASGWRAVWTATGVGVIIVGSFALWDPRAFVHSVIEFHLIQPFRRDSISLLPGLDDVAGPLPRWLLAASPIVGFVVSAIIAIRTRPGATALALGVGMALLVTVLLSKQAHMNYYYLVGSALLLAVVTWHGDDPIPEKQL